LFIKISSLMQGAINRVYLRTVGTPILRSGILFCKPRKVPRTVRSTLAICVLNPLSARTLLLTSKIVWFEM
jgi:hypothetical protein